MLTVVVVVVIPERIQALVLDLPTVSVEMIVRQIPQQPVPQTAAWVVVAARSMLLALVGLELVAAAELSSSAIRILTPQRL